MSSQPFFATRRGLGSHELFRGADRGESRQESRAEQKSRAGEQKVSLLLYIVLLGHVLFVVGGARMGA